MYSIPCFGKFTSVLSVHTCCADRFPEGPCGQSYCVEHYAYLKFIWLGMVTKTHGPAVAEFDESCRGTVTTCLGGVFATTLMRMITDATVDMRLSLYKARGHHDNLDTCESSEHNIQAFVMVQGTNHGLDTPLLR
jgi:hypothetical protein